MIKSQIARKWRTKYPDMPSHALSRLIYKAKGMNAVFIDKEDVRSALRYVEGKRGAKLAKQVADKSLVLNTPRSLNPYNLPESDKRDWPPFVIQGATRVAIWSDIHFPYQDNEVLTLAIKEAKKRKVDSIVLNGDLIDFYQLSRFDKDPTRRSFAGELEAVKSFFAILRKRFPSAKIYFKLGNHEERYEKYMLAKCRELLGVDDFRLERLLDCEKYGVEVIDKKRIIHLNGLSLIHGHEFVQGMFSPVNIARGLFLRAKTSAMQGHNHSTSEHTEPNLNGEITTTWSTGCMCELHPDYMPINKWNHGFAFVDLDADGVRYYVKNIRVFEGKML